MPQTQENHRVKLDRENLTTKLETGLKGPVRDLTSEHQDSEICLYHAKAEDVKAEHFERVAFFLVGKALKESGYELRGGFKYADYENVQGKIPQHVRLRVSYEGGILDIRAEEFEFKKTAYRAED